MIPMTVVLRVGESDGKPLVRTKDAHVRRGTSLDQSIKRIAVVLRNRAKMRRDASPVRFAAPRSHGIHGTPSFNPPNPGVDTSGRDGDPLWQYHRGQDVELGKGTETYRGCSMRPNAYVVIDRSQHHLPHENAKNDPPDGMVHLHPDLIKVSDEPGAWRIRIHTEGGRSPAEVLSANPRLDTPIVTHAQSMGDIEFIRQQREAGVPEDEIDRLLTERFQQRERQPNLTIAWPRAGVFEFHGRGHGRPMHHAIFPLQDLELYAAKGDPYRIWAASILGGNRHAIPFLVRLLKSRDNPAGWWNGWVDLHRRMEREQGDLTPEQVAIRLHNIAEATKDESHNPEEHAQITSAAHDHFADVPQTGDDLYGYQVLSDHMEEHGLPHYAALIRSELANVIPDIIAKPKGRQRFARKSELSSKLDSLRPEIAKAAQLVYDECVGDPEMEGHGICDSVSSAIGDVLTSHGIDHTDGGHDGDDHAYRIAYDKHSAHVVDIPPDVYEHGGGYNWTIHKDVQFHPNHVEIFETHRPDWIDDESEHDMSRRAGSLVHRFRRLFSPQRFAVEHPSNRQNYPMFSTGLMERVAHFPDDLAVSGAPKDIEEHMRNIRSDTGGKVIPKPLPFLAGGKFAGSPDARRLGDGPVHGFSDHKGSLKADSSHALAERLAASRALTSLGVPINDAKWGREAFHRHIEAAANVLREYSGHPAAQAYLRATMLRAPDINALDATTRPLMMLAREVHPFLKVYDQLAASRRERANQGAGIDDRPSVYTQPEVFDSIDLLPEHPSTGAWDDTEYEDGDSSHKEEPLQLADDFVWPTPKPIKDLPTIKPALVPGEMGRKGDDPASRRGTLVALQASGATTPKMVEELMRRFLLTAKQAKAAVKRFVGKPKKMWRVGELVRLAREPGKPSKFASTQINLPPDLANMVRELGQRIPDEHLADDGREDNPHVTVKYGLHSDDPDAAMSIVGTFKPFRIGLGRISTFPARDASGYDVVKIEVHSPVLHQLNKAIAEGVESTDTHPTYRPHVTIAYVKPGLGKQYETSKLMREVFTANHVLFSPKSRTDYVVMPLAGSSKPKKMWRVGKPFLFGKKAGELVSAGSLEPFPDRDKRYAHRPIPTFHVPKEAILKSAYNPDNPWAGTIKIKPESQLAAYHNKIGDHNYVMLAEPRTGDIHHLAEVFCDSTGGHRLRLLGDPNKSRKDNSDLHSPISAAAVSDLKDGYLHAYQQLAGTRTANPLSNPSREYVVGEDLARRDFYNGELGRSLPQQFSLQDRFSMLGFTRLPNQHHNNPGRRRERLLGSSSVVQSAKARAARFGHVAVVVDHGGGAHYNRYESSTDAVVAVAHPDGRTMVWHAVISGNKPTYAGAASITGNNELRKMFDDRFATKRDEIHRRMVPVLKNLLDVAEQHGYLISPRHPSGVLGNKLEHAIRDSGPLTSKPSSEHDWRDDAIAAIRNGNFAAASRIADWIDSMGGNSSRIRELLPRIPKKWRFRRTYPSAIRVNPLPNPN